jgi:Icc-related predicted phosphoesterase
MKIAAVSDLHNNFSQLRSISHAIAEVDLVLAVGDLNNDDEANEGDSSSF